MVAAQSYCQRIILLNEQGVRCGTLTESGGGGGRGEVTSSTKQLGVQPTGYTEVPGLSVPVQNISSDCSSCILDLKPTALILVHILQLTR